MQEYYYPRLKDIREDNDKTQKDIPSHHIVTLAKYYNVSTDYLLGLSNKK